MARYILCPACNENMKALAEKHSELFESIEGKARELMLCDGACGGITATEINKGDTCHAAVLLPSKEHVTFSFQKPEKWANQLLIPSVS